jgi:Ti-type conjugative transfer relaxase TraA
VREACEAQGHRVRGLALSGIAAESLQNESGIPSKTIHRQLLDWNNDRARLGKNEILVLDEAGMVGTRLMHEVLGHAREAGAKVVLVGDNEQLQSIEAGGSFRGIIHRTGYVELADVRRQKIEWQKDATREFSGRKDQVEKAIEMYRDHGSTNEHMTKEEAKDQLMKDWADYRTNNKQRTSLMLAYTNRDVADLNLGARQYRKLSGDLCGAEYTIMTEKGERKFCAGDRILFLRNESSLGVRNGTLGTIEKINRGSMAVKLDKGDMVAFDIHMYKDFDHGYAATVHKTQGSTIDRTFVLGTRHFDKHTAYVAMSRHREDVTLYFSKDEFKSFEDLQRVMGRERPKGLVIDYGLPRGIEPDDRLIQAERMMSMEDISKKAQEDLLRKAEEQYVKQMKGKGIHVEFPQGKAVEGYYTRVEEIGGNKYAVIDTHADPAKGVRYMIPYDKQYDQMMKHRFVTYDGQNMGYAKVKSAEKGIEKNKGPGLGK